MVYLTYNQERLLNGVIMMGNANTKLLSAAFKKLMTEWQTLLNFGLGMATLIGLLAFGYALTQLIMNADNPQARQEAISNLLKVGITTAAIGGFWTFTVLIIAAFM